MEREEAGEGDAGENDDFTKLLNAILVRLSQLATLLLALHRGTAAAADGPRSAAQLAALHARTRADHDLLLVMLRHYMNEAGMTSQSSGTGEHAEGPSTAQRGPTAAPWSGARPARARDQAARAARRAGAPAPVPARGAVVVRGIRNLGNTCFASSVLQVLFSNSDMMAQLVRYAAACRLSVAGGGGGGGGGGADDVQIYGGVDYSTIFRAYTAVRPMQAGAILQQVEGAAGGAARVQGARAAGAAAPPPLSFGGAAPGRMPPRAGAAAGVDPTALFAWIRDRTAAAAPAGAAGRGAGGFSANELRVGGQQQDGGEFVRFVLQDRVLPREVVEATFGGSTRTTTECPCGECEPGVTTDPFRLLEVAILPESDNIIDLRPAPAIDGSEVAQGRSGAARPAGATTYNVNFEQPASGVLLSRAAGPRAAGSRDGARLQLAAGGAALARPPDRTLCDLLKAHFPDNEEVPDFLCRHTGTRVTARRRFEMLEAPKHLLIALKRTVLVRPASEDASAMPLGVKVADRVDFDDVLQVECAAAAGRAGAPGAGAGRRQYRYMLYAVVFHEGDSPDSGHNFAAALVSSGVDAVERSGAWFSFNDSDARRLESFDRDVRSTMQWQSGSPRAAEQARFTVPYLFAYVRVDDAEGD